MTKYKNKKTVVKVGEDSYAFDSQKEAKYFTQLLTLLKAGVISDLKLQPEFEIIPTTKWNGKTLCKIKYVADFQYKKDDVVFVVDVKGFKTDVYNLKKRLFLLQYPQYIFLEA